MQKNEKGHEWAPNGSVWRSDKAKMLIKTFPDVLEKNVFSEKSSGGPRSRSRHQWWCINTPRTSLDTSEKKWKIEISVNLFDAYDRLRLSSSTVSTIKDRVALFCCSLFCLHDSRFCLHDSRFCLHGTPPHHYYEKTCFSYFFHIFIFLHFHIIVFTCFHIFSHFFTCVFMSSHFFTFVHMFFYIFRLIKLKKGRRGGIVTWKRATYVRILRNCRIYFRGSLEGGINYNKHILMCSECLYASTTAYYASKMYLF
jgi:hypothetical protein